MDVANKIPPWTRKVRLCHAPHTPWGWFPWRLQECAELERTCWLADAGRVREDEGGGQGRRSSHSACNESEDLPPSGQVSDFSSTNTARPPPVPHSRSLGPNARSRKLACARCLSAHLTHHCQGSARLSLSLKPFRTTPDLTLKFLMTKHMHIHHLMLLVTGFCVLSCNHKLYICWVPRLGLTAFSCPSKN